MQQTIETLTAKLETLTPEQLAQLDTFIATLQLSDNRGEGVRTSDAARWSEAAFASVWDNPEDAAYDEL